MQPPGQACGNRPPGRTSPCPNNLTADPSRPVTGSAPLERCCARCVGHHQDARAPAKKRPRGQLTEMRGPSCQSSPATATRTLRSPSPQGTARVACHPRRHQLRDRPRRPAHTQARPGLCRRDHPRRGIGCRSSRRICATPLASRPRPGTTPAGTPTGPPTTASGRPGISERDGSPTAQVEHGSDYLSQPLLTVLAGCQSGLVCRIGDRNWLTPGCAVSIWSNRVSAPTGICPGVWHCDVLPVLSCSARLRAWS